MYVTLLKFVSLAIGILPVLIVTGSVSAETPSCAMTAPSCARPAKMAPADGRFRVAQAPSTVNSGPEVEIERPDGKVPREAFDALAEHCARCHQEGRLKRAKPASDFGNILQLDEIASDPHLIRPGNPDGSPLFSRIVKQEMPYDVYTEFSGGSEPSKEDVQAIYDWIESLDPKTVAGCGNRKPVDTAQLVSSISGDLNKRPANRRKSMRYLTLTNHFNACVKDEDLRRMRNGAALLLNSLSRKPKMAGTTALGRAGSIIAFNLDDIGWSPEDWDTLVASYPYGIRPKSGTFDQVKNTTGTPLPYLRADWFAAAASRPPLYYKLLGLPDELQELHNQLGVDAQSNRDDGKVMRAGLEQSGVSWHNRVVERHPVGEGYLWQTFDFDDNDPQKNIMERPLGPDRDKGFEHDMNAVLFSLPNGMNAFFLSRDDGNRIDTAPAEVLHDETHPRRPVIAGLSCFSCHSGGVRNVTDEVRGHVATSASFTASVRDEVESLYAIQDELDRQVSDDHDRYANAASRTGIRIEKKDDGLDDLTYLVRAFEKRLDLRIAAAEHGVTGKQYADGMTKAGEEAQRTKQQLEQGTMARRQFEPLFLQNAVAVSADVPVGRVKAPGSIPKKPPLGTKTVIASTKKSGGTKTGNKKAGGKVDTATARPKPKKPAKTKKTASKDNKPKTGTKVAAASPRDNGAEADERSITLVSNKSSYQRNDLPVFTVNASSDCNLTLINVDSSGQATVIFPNKYQQENFIHARTDFEFPGPDAPFQFRLSDVGKEKLIAECEIDKNGDRIAHNFEQEDFTDLGDYRDHVGEQAEKEGEKKTTSKKKNALLRTAITFNVR